MENATKALIIAASVLVVIILIAISIRILSSTSNVTNQVDTVSSNLETSMFNSQFISYVGNNVSGTQVKSLISKIIVNNAQNAGHQITVNSKSSQADLSNISNGISNNGLYSVSATSYDSDGYLTAITVQ